MIKQLTSKRILLRPMKTSDADKVLEIRFNDSVTKFIDRVKIKSVDEANQFISKIIEGNNTGDWRYWVISLKDQTDLIGTICLWNFNNDKTTAEIGYELLPKYQGLGYVCESIDNVIEFGFSELKLEKITAWTHPKNFDSIKVLKKKGFNSKVKVQLRELFPNSLHIPFSHSKIKN